VEVDRNDLVDRADHGVAAFEHAAAERAVAGRHDPFRVGRRRVGALERDLHVAGDRPGDEQHVGVARRRGEPDSKALHIIDRIVEGVDL